MAASSCHIGAQPSYLRERLQSLLLRRSRPPRSWRRCPQNPNARLSRSVSPRHQLRQVAICHTRVRGLRPQASSSRAGQGGMERARKLGKRIGRRSVTERDGFAERFTEVVERIGPGGLSHGQAARELDIDFATLKRPLDHSKTTGWWHSLVA